MHVIVCLDEKLGMTFNSRRQSSDRVLRERILNYAEKSCLWMNGYSAEMFGEHDCIKVHPRFLKKAKTGDYCFVENDDIKPFCKEIEKLIVYKWNRHYPADLYFDLELANNWEMVSSEDFVGSSHEKITEEIYIK